MNVEKIDEFSISVTSQPPTPDLEVTILVRSVLENRLASIQADQDRQNAIYETEKESVQASIDLCEENGVLHQ